MTGKQLSRFTASTAALASVVLWSGVTMAQTALRVADSFPTGHYIAENQTKPWMEKMKELTGGKVSFQYFPAEQLGKQRRIQRESCGAAFGQRAVTFVHERADVAEQQRRRKR